VLDVPGERIPDARRNVATRFPGVLISLAIEAARDCRAAERKRGKIIRRARSGGAAEPGVLGACFDAWMLGDEGPDACAARLVFAETVMAQSVTRLVKKMQRRRYNFTIDIPVTAGGVEGASQAIKSLETNLRRC